MQLHYDHISQMDLGLFLRMIKAMEEHDARDILSRIQVPTLIIAGGRDIFTRYSVQEKTHKDIPDSEFLKIPLGTHVLPLEQPELINSWINKFLQEKIWPGEGQA